MGGFHPGRKNCALCEPLPNRLRKSPLREPAKRAICAHTGGTGLAAGFFPARAPPMQRSAERAASAPTMIQRFHLKAPVALLAVALALSGASPRPARAQEASDCLACHGDRTLETERGGRHVSLYVDETKFNASVHGPMGCTGCHADVAGLEHTDLHGRAEARGDPLAPRCKDCHGNHDILPVKSQASAVAPQKIPFVCGRCHREGSPVSLQREIHESNILANYTESIHGEGLLKKGLIVAATCASCHTPHQILPHTDPRSSIARENIATTCTKCHAQIEAVHRKIVRGELWEKAPNHLPACVDCHQPHKARKVFYDQGMADRDCLSCHESPDLRASKDGRSLYVDAAELARSKHVRTACSQCHTGVDPSKRRPCETLTTAVDCSVCHAQTVEQYQGSIHGELAAKQDPNAPVCRDCHGTHGVLGKQDPASRTFPTNVPELCARCHREGEKAAARYKGPEHDIITHYTESIHGKGLLKSGLVVTAMCTDCHTAHGERPASDPSSTVNPKNLPSTCGRCHHGIEEMFVRSVHSPSVTRTDKALPVCSDCHSAHSIRRTDLEGFRLKIMDQCGRCHQEIAKTYFDTYHGKVSRLGYAKTAKCYDCHGAHDILKVTDPDSHLSRENVVATCQKCHPGATRRFAGYLTHATHHDPKKYPWLFWTFWGMTTLLVGTFIVGGLHTVLWIPRAIQWRREINREEQAARAQEKEEGADHD
jgi:uncharacterized protein with PIN domain